MDEPFTSSRQADQKQWREKFLTEILESEIKNSSHYNVLSSDKYSELIEQVEDAEKSADELYDVIDAAHVAVGHGGHDRMLAETSKKYAKITKEMISLYLSMCDVCQQKKTKKKRGLVSKPILHSEMNSRCQVDLIDFQTQPDEQFKFIMVYQDHLTKFVLLRALTSKRAAEVTYNLNDIFLTIGAPCILQSDNGREFVNNVISELASLWPELKIVHGKPRHSQSQGSVERANQDIENMISSWLKDNDSTKWSEGLRYVQFMKNPAFHSGIKQSPYKALFGIEPRDEDDLRKVIEDNSNCNQNEDGNGGVMEIDTQNIQEARKAAAENLEKQAKKIKASSDKSHPPAYIGDILLYQYQTTEFDICIQKFLEVGDVNQDIEISLRTAATKHSVGSGLGFVRYSCVKKCLANRCNCKKKQVLCNSKCHQSTPCKNK
ncbi:KRAB-A domain-containing protein 2-like [Anoplophora glabripennis]|uniref:KRAB-A domain-containing protein 2-like n=1 Tax=Anoplophora glabripennis TaxID=217634 RepID=UPI000C78FAF1|nr:KRAB-A domain-containing protein 2-like [Anoplophora glabripennis]